MSLADLLRKGRQAEQLMMDPLFLEAVQSVRTGIQAQIEDSDFSQADQREDAYRMLRALKAVTGQIEKHIRAAKGAEAEEQEKLRAVKRVAEIRGK